MAGPSTGVASGTAEPSWLDTERPAMRPDVEITEGLHHEPLAYDPVSGHYTRLSRSGAAILTALDGSMTGREFAARASGAGRGDGSTQRVVLDFLGELRAAGLLTVPPDGGRGASAVRFARRSHMPRRPLVGSGVRAVLDPPAALLRRAPLPFGVLWTAAAVLAVWGAGSALAAPLASGGPALSLPVWGWTVVVCSMLLQTALHELAHGLACRYYGVPVREIGVGLLFYLVPVAYVDRTDAHRLPGRGSRVVIALAGVAQDVLWLGGWSALSLYADGQFGQLSLLMVWLQIGLLLANLNPLLPTDGYHALESAMGTLNLRSRAFTALRCRVLRQPPPSWLAVRSRSRQLRYQVFGVVCLAYALLVAVFCVRSLLALFGGV
ncbi:hypothetical protein AB0K47_07645 [Streptomyces tirandamycinicus]|uniref:PqqD family protein n=1 Tax=Streptomyces tirandamycinicus TaxID=2174846 RepID=UPI0034463098